MPTAATPSLLNSLDLILRSSRRYSNARRFESRARLTNLPTSDQYRRHAGPLSCSRSYRTSIFLFLWLVTRLGTVIDGHRLGAFSFFVVIADSTGMGLLAFLA